MFNSIQIATLIKMLNNTIDKELNKNFAHLELSSTQALVLEYLFSHQEKMIYQKDIETEFNFSHPTVTGILKLLSEKGFVTCVADKKDHRFKRILLKEKASDIYTEMLSLHQQTLNKLFKNLAPEEIALLEKLLARAANNIISK